MPPPGGLGQSDRPAAGKCWPCPRPSRRLPASRPSHPARLALPARVAQPRPPLCPAQGGGRPSFPPTTHLPIASPAPGRGPAGPGTAVALGPASARPVCVARGLRPTSRALHVRVEWGVMASATPGAPRPSPPPFMLFHLPVFCPFCPQLPHVREPSLPGLRHLLRLTVHAECTILTSLVPTGGQACPLLCIL